MNIKKKCSIILLITCISVNATRSRFGDLENMTFSIGPDKFTTASNQTLKSFIAGPLALFLVNKSSFLINEMSLNRSEMEKHFLINTGINLIVAAINFCFLLPRAAACPDRNNNVYINTATRINFVGVLAVGIGSGYLSYQRTEKTRSYENAADRLFELAKKDRSPEETLEMYFLLRKLTVTKETQPEDMYSFKGYGQLTRDSDGNWAFRKVTG